MTLPNFIVIGAGKGGTTSLYHYLRQHPEIFVSAIKETNFFAWDAERPGARVWETEQPNEFPVQSLDAYRALFADAGDAIAVGEVSPIYLTSLFAPQRIRDLLPDVKLVATLRNPVDRAYSGYWMQVQAGFESRPPEESFGPDEHRVRAGFYADLLDRYYALFPRDRIKLLIFEEWRRDPVAGMQDLYAFLGVRSDFAPRSDVVHNAGGIPRNAALDRILGSQRLRSLVEPIVPGALRDAVVKLRKRNLAAPPPLSPELRRAIEARYREDWERLEERLGRPLDAWRNAAR